MFCDRRSYLCGIAIGCLSSADDQVRAADHLDPLCERIRGGKHIGSCKFSVREYHRIVSTHRISIAHHFLCLRRSHRQYRYGSSHFFTDLKGCLQRKQIVRIRPGLPGHSFHGTGFRVNIYFGTGRYLFHTYYDFHTFYFFLYFLTSTL